MRACAPSRTVNLVLALSTLFLLCGVLRAQSLSYRPELQGFRRLGYIQPKDSLQIADSYWGIQPGSMDPKVLQRAAQIGVKWTRLQASWSSIERDKGKYNWDATDQAFDLTLRSGITPFVCLVGANRLYSPVLAMQDPKMAEIFGQAPAPPTQNETAMAAWLNFVQAAVLRYKGRIHYWEIWNEPNHRAYWGADPDPKEYGRLVRETTAVIRKADPQAKVIAGALAGMDAQFLDGFLAAADPKRIDIVSYHQYEGEPEDRIVRMVKFRQAIDKYNPAIITWQGECGSPSASSTRDFRGSAPWGLYIQAKWLLRQAFSDTFLSGSQLSNYFLLQSVGDRDERQPRSFLTDPEKVIGYYPTRADGAWQGARARRTGINEKSLLNYPSGEPKPAYYAYQNLCAVLDRSFQPVHLRMHIDVLDSGIFYGIGIPDDAFPSVPIVATFEREDKTPLLAYWLPWHGQEYLPELARVRVEVDQVTMHHPVLIDPISGEVFAIEDWKTENGNVTFDLPLADYPFILTEDNAISLRTSSAKHKSDATPGGIVATSR